MGSISLRNVSRQFGGRVVLDDVSLELHTGETVGLVGPNGAGKTTLFRLITGQLPPDSGVITRSRGLDIGYLPQEPDIAPDRTLHDEVAEAFADVLAIEKRAHDLAERIAAAHDDPALPDVLAEYDRVQAQFIAADGYLFEQRLQEVLGGVGFGRADYDLKMAALSGGQKSRAALARLLLRPRSFLLLDEPTNHLDVDAVRWLEKFLAGYQGGAAIVSHDRYLLDRLVDRIVEVDNARLVSYPGNYTNYVESRRVRELTQERRYEQDAAYIAQQRDFIARHQAGQRSREARGRLTRLERRLADGEFVTQRPSQRKTVALDFDTQALTGRTVLEVVDLAKRYGDKRLFENLSLQIAAGQRIGITGPNGAGKTTLLKIIIGRLPADAGSARIDPKATLGCFSQEAEELDPDRSVIDEIRSVRRELSEPAARNILGRFLFCGDDVFKKLGLLSGGEQSRVRLAKLILAAPNTLILDEPTNHLDIASREALEDALLEYPGTIIVVSHDRYFLDRIVGRLLVLRLGAHRLINGNYTDYVEQLEREAAADASTSPAAASAAPARAPAMRRAADAQRRAGEASAYAGWTLERIETGIMDREQRLSEINRSFADPAVLRSASEVPRLRDEFQTIKSELAELEAEWARKVDGGS
jgi:ATP-binding cassette subfamily F protein 3